MPKLPQVTSKKIMKVLKKENFSTRPGKGSHVVLEHPDGRRTVVPMHNKPLSKGTLHSILKQVNLSVDDLSKLL